MNTSQAKSWQESYAPEEKQIVKVKKTGWITKGEKILYSLIGLSIIAGCIFMVSYASSTDSVNRNLESLETDVKKQEVTNEGLQYEKKELSRPERIIKIARENDFKIQDAEVKQAQAFSD